ncbi:DotU family type IV/VI secretion system protein [Chitinimonas viridis]|uniref:DotU family type IV/VI secretion system protein n=2 Tax=Chitinimonas TaxID=240411 RepID=A0ABT8BA34_9NEIS|nr:MULTISPECIES: DotU family type IV/VI secretion system protein [Chitinimonas]MDN3579006.1 DotU family type IV/VI secretion system protein [Chitinimonas viridis]GLR12858.1 hypothetical protein GCM10007907_16480 [Chitinimonas prasina]
MTDTTWSDGALLARFTEFYEDVAVIKQAIAHGRLPLLLGGDLPAHASPADLASMVSGRLSQRLLQQGREMAVSSPEAELRAYRIVQFVMAGLGDEVFILEVDWPGNTHWLSNLIEYALFRRQQAGRTYFELLGNLLHTRGRGRLQLELGIIFLLTLQLGFKGEYRGQHGQAALASYRSKLLRYIADRRPLVSADKPVFSQAYSHTLIVKDDHRLAPMKPWYRAGAIALLVYLVVSTAIWLQTLVPLTAKLDSYMGGG